MLVMHHNKNSFSLNGHAHDSRIPKARHALGNPVAPQPQRLGGRNRIPGVLLPPR